MDREYKQIFSQICLPTPLPTSQLLLPLLPISLTTQPEQTLAPLSVPLHSCNKHYLNHHSLQFNSKHLPCHYLNIQFHIIVTFGRQFDRQLNNKLLNNTLLQDFLMNWIKTLASYVKECMTHPRIWTHRGMWDVTKRNVTIGFIFWCPTHIYGER